jgi:pimeloyl-ACP methyl ester carboxylesterase
MIYAIGICFSFIIVLIIYKKLQLNDFSNFDEKSTSGRFVKLNRGRVHYNRYGKSDDNTVVLVHGILTPSFVWEGVVNTLVQAGNEVITFDLYGRGYSERLNTPHNEQLYNEQLLNLLDSLGITKPIDLIGYSLGGGIATSFTSQYPQKVKKLGLIAPAGFMSELPLVARISKLPLIGKYITHLLIPIFTIKRQEKAYQEGSISSEALFNIKQQFSYKGTIESFISTDKYYPYNDLKKAYDLVGKSKIPVSLIWGENDNLMFYKFSKEVLKVIPLAEFHSIPNASHSITYEQSDKVGAILKSFVSTAQV